MLIVWDFQAYTTGLLPMDRGAVLQVELAVIHSHGLDVHLPG